MAAKKKATPRKTGRPSKYSDALAMKICNKMADGESLKAICKPDNMPSCVTVRTWRNAKPGFLVMYARAREDQADFYADEIIEIADTEPDSSKARNRIDARKWKASRLAPKVWGDRQIVDLNDHRNSPRDYSEAELSAIIANGSGDGIAGEEESPVGSDSIH